MCITGSSGAEGSSPGRLTSSLEHSMPNAPMSSVQPVPHKHQGVGSSDNHRMHRSLGIGSIGATDFCRTLPIQCFFELFLRVLLCLAFCFIPGIYKCSLNKLISPIYCVVHRSLKSQDNGLIGPCSLHQIIISYNHQFNNLL